MLTFTTRIKAKCPHTGDLLSYSGPLIRAISIKDAQQWCDNNGLGYCEVTCIVVSTGEVDEEGMIINQKHYDRVVYN